MNKANSEFINTLKKIESLNSQINPRDQKVKEILLHTMELDPEYPIVDFQNRKFNWKYLTGELLWYISKKRKVDYILKFSNFWNNIKDYENKINSNYGNLLLGKQLSWALNSLIKDKNSRQAIAFLNRPKFQYNGNKDFVCSIYLIFFIRDEKLHMKVTMRSQDMFWGFSYDAPWFSLIQQHMFLWLKDFYPDLKLGTYYHYTDNIHYYERHFDLVKNILSENPLDNKDIKFSLKTPIFYLDKKQLIVKKDIKEYTKIAGIWAEDKTENRKKYSDYKNLLSKYIKIEIN